MSTFIHKMKCMGCGLHFALFSWEKERDNQKTWCPECGMKGSKIHWMEESDKQIFEFVPGDNLPIVAIGGQSVGI